jgi:hypothetical protein
MTADFRKLKGRYYKKTHHWVFPLEIENILLEKTESINTVLNENNNVFDEKDDSIQTDESVEMEESLDTNESIQTDESVEIVNPIKYIDYKYKPPQEFYKYISTYII